MTSADGEWQSSHSPTYIRTVSVLLSALLITSSYLKKTARKKIRHWCGHLFFHVVSSHSCIISYNLKWCKTSVVFTTMFHRALLSCRRQRSWIVSSVWILAPRLWLRCWLWDIESSLISMSISEYTPAFYRCRVWVSRQDSAISDIGS
jgi:hypothetical protein